MTRRQRLIVIASTFPGRPGDGTPEFVRDLSVRLGKSFDTVVLVPRVPGGVTREEFDGIVVERFRYFPKRWEGLAHGAILENLRSNRWRWLQVPPFLLAEAFRLRRLIRRHRPDVIHVHWVVPQGIAALAVARRVPWVVTTLGGDVYALRDPLSRRLTRAVLTRAKAVTTMNTQMRQRLLESGADPATTYVQPLGADIAQIREMAGATEEIPGRILFVGRLVEKKGAAILLEAVRRLPDTESWSLEIIGDGPLLDELVERARGLPVTFSGTATRHELATAYARSSVVAVPSVAAASGDQDGLPTVLLEAMGCGRIVVASDLPGINEAVVDGSTGLLVPSDDPAGLAKALQEALDDPDLRARLGEAAAIRSEDYTVDTCVERFVEIVAAAAQTPVPT